MKKLHFGTLALAFALFGTALSGCAAADGGRNFIPGGEAATGEAGMDGGGGAMPSDPGDTGDAGDVSDGVQTVPAGQLTAGAWDDNADYSFFKGLFETSVTIACGEQGSEEAEPGLFAAYLPGEDRKNAWGMSVLNRVEVTVTDGEGNPAAGAKVVLEGEGESLAAFRARTERHIFSRRRRGNIPSPPAMTRLCPQRRTKGAGLRRRSPKRAPIPSWICASWSIPPDRWGTNSSIYRRSSAT